MIDCKKEILKKFLPYYLLFFGAVTIVAALLGKGKLGAGIGSRRGSSSPPIFHNGYDADDGPECGQCDDDDIDCGQMVKVNELQGDHNDQQSGYGIFHF